MGMGELKGWSYAEERRFRAIIEASNNQLTRLQAIRLYRRVKNDAKAIKVRAARAVV